MAWLDNLLGLNDPSQAAQMGLGAGLLQASGPSLRPVSTGQAIAQGLLGGRQAGMETQQSMRRDQLVQAQLMHSLLQMQEYQRKVQQEKAIEEAAKGAFGPGVQNWQPGQGAGMPSPENIGTSIAPSFDRQAFLSNLAKVSPIKAMEMMQKQQPIHVAAGGTLFDTNDNRPIFTAPAKPNEGPGSIREYQFAVQGGYKGSYEDWMRISHPGTNLTVGLQAPVAIQDPNDPTKTILTQPGNRPGAPPQVLTAPGGSPARPASPVVRPDVVAQRAYNSNMSSIKQIDEAIAEVKANPNAFGLTMFMGDEANQRLDPKGVGPRAKVANIGSLKRHDRTGAAMSMAEAPILRPFIPEVTNDPLAIVTKLEALKRELINHNSTLGIDPQSGGGQSGDIASQARAELERRRANGGR